MQRVSTTIALCLFTIELAAATAAAQPQTREEIEAFMRAAKVVRVRELSTGVTRPRRLTLSDGVTTHDAVFQAIDEYKKEFTPATGPRQLNFVDSWRYNVAAYRIAGLLGLEAMIPVTIEYRHQGRTGALSWWMDSLMDERERLRKKVSPPDPEAWNQDMHRLRVFTELVHDTDRNLGNVLVSPEWRVIMLDFTRAFRVYNVIRPKELQRCDRALLARLEALTPDAAKAAVEEYLTPAELAGVLKRRDLIVAHVKQLVAERGEGRVLY